MNIFLDLVFILIFLIFILVCYIRGFAKSVWGLVSQAASCILAFIFGSTLGRFLLLDFWTEKEYTASHAGLFSDICGYLIVYLASSVILTVAGFFIKKAARSEALSTTDSVLGGLFGAATALVVILVICIALSLVLELNINSESISFLRESAENSFIFGLVVRIVPFDYIELDKLLDIAEEVKSSALATVSSAVSSSAGAGSSVIAP